LSQAATLLRFGLGTAALAFALALPPGCAKPPDNDGAPEGAVQIPLETWKSEGLFCEESDCIDFYKFEAPDPGRVSVEVVSASREEEPVPPYTIFLTDGEGVKLGDGKSGKGPLAGLQAHADRPGMYFVAIEAVPDSVAFGYDLRVSFTPDPPPPPPPRKPKETKHRPPSAPSSTTSPPPPPPPPRIEKLTGVVIEVEGASGQKVDAVLIDLGAQRGVQQGMRGRLLERGRPIANIEVIEVYRTGSRARVDGYVSGAIGASTVVEVEVPTGVR
jgi:hypothetical protein